MTPKALMILGTASHVGKSLVTAGLGRIFSDDGIRVAPFKAQNMSLNSAATPDGREIGRAQALQAEACRVVRCAEMNPVLIIVRENGTTSIPDGAIGPSGRVFGTYVHGLFDDDAFRHAFLDSVREACGLAPARDYLCVEREARIDRWADHLRQSLDMDLIRGWL